MFLIIFDFIVGVLSFIIKTLLIPLDYVLSQIVVQQMSNVDLDGVWYYFTETPILGYLRLVMYWVPVAGILSVILTALSILFLACLAKIIVKLF